MGIRGKPFKITGPNGRNVLGKRTFTTKARAQTVRRAIIRKVKTKVLFKNRPKSDLTRARRLKVRTVK